MLNDSRVLNYVKRNLGFPFMHLEWKDEEILEYAKEETIREWSYYVPDVKKIGLNLQAEANKVPGRVNEWYINEPEGREILNVVDVYFDQGELFALGHPPFGVFNHFELRDELIHKGYVFKTWEGRLIQVGFKTPSPGAMQSNEFDFSIANDSLAKILELSSGESVELTYKEYFNAVPWRGASNYIVTDIVSIEKPKDSSGGLPY